MPLAMRSLLILVLLCGGCADPCDELRAECSECEGRTEALCEASVSSLSLVGGDDACQEALDSGGPRCADVAD